MNDKKIKRPLNHNHILSHPNPSMIFQPAINGLDSLRYPMIRNMYRPNQYALDSNFAHYPGTPQGMYQPNIMVLPLQKMFVSPQTYNNSIQYSYKPQEGVVPQGIFQNTNIANSSNDNITTNTPVTINSTDVHKNISYGNDQNSYDPSITTMGSNANYAGITYSTPSNFIPYYGNPNDYTLYAPYASNDKPAYLLPSAVSSANINPMISNAYYPTYNGIKNQFSHVNDALSAQPYSSQAVPSNQPNSTLFIPDNNLRTSAASTTTSSQTAPPAKKSTIIIVNPATGNSYTAQELAKDNDRSSVNEFRNKVTSKAFAPDEDEENTVDEMEETRKAEMEIPSHIAIEVPHLDAISQKTYVQNKEAGENYPNTNFDHNVAEVVPRALSKDFIIQTCIDNEDDRQNPDVAAVDIHIEETELQSEDIKLPLIIPCETFQPIVIDQHVIPHPEISSKKPVDKPQTLPTVLFDEPPTAPIATDYSSKDVEPSSKQTNNTSLGIDEFKNVKQQPHQLHRPATTSSRKMYSKMQMLEIAKIVDPNLYPAVLSSYECFQDKRYAPFGNKRSSGPPGMGGPGSSNMPPNLFDYRYSNNPYRNAFPGGYGSLPPLGRDYIDIRQPYLPSPNLELPSSENDWKSLNKMKADMDPEEFETQKLVGKVKTILNKMAPNNFAALIEDFHNLIPQISTPARAIEVVGVIFTKALFEPIYADGYANFIKVLSQSAAQYKPCSILLNMAQKEFYPETNDERIAKDTELKKSIEECEDENEKKILEDDYHEYQLKLRDRYLGNMKFLSELYKCSLISNRILSECLNALLRAKTDLAYEGLCNLLKFVGKHYTSSDKENSINQIVDKLVPLLNDKSLSSRIRYMLIDIIELKQNNWVPRRHEETPKTIEQIARDIALENEENKRIAAMAQKKIAKRQNISSSSATTPDQSSSNKFDGMSNNLYGSSQGSFVTIGGSSSGNTPTEITAMKNLAQRPFSNVQRSDTNIDNIKLAPASKWRSRTNNINPSTTTNQQQNKYPPNPSPQILSSTSNKPLSTFNQRNMTDTTQLNSSQIGNQTFVPGNYGNIASRTPPTGDEPLQNIKMYPGQTSASLAALAISGSYYTSKSSSSLSRTTPMLQQTPHHPIQTNNRFAIYNQEDEDDDDEEVEDDIPEEEEEELIVETISIPIVMDKEGVLGDNKLSRPSTLIQPKSFLKLLDEFFNTDDDTGFVESCLELRDNLDAGCIASPTVLNHVFDRPDSSRVKYSQALLDILEALTLPTHVPPPNIIKAQDILIALSLYLSNIEDIIEDYPKIFKYIADIIIPLVVYDEPFMVVPELELSKTLGEDYLDVIVSSLIEPRYVWQYYMALLNAIIDYYNHNIVMLKQKKTTTTTTSTCLPKCLVELRKIILDRSLGHLSQSISQAPPPPKDTLHAANHVTTGAVDKSIYSPSTNYYYNNNKQLVDMTVSYFAHLNESVRFITPTTTTNIPHPSLTDTYLLDHLTQMLDRLSESPDHTDRVGFALDAFSRSLPTGSEKSISLPRHFATLLSLSEKVKTHCPTHATHFNRLIHKSNPQAPTSTDTVADP